MAEDNLMLADGVGINRPKEPGKFNAWKLSFYGALTAIGYLCISKPDPYWDILRFVPDGVLVTFQVTTASICVALLLGLITGLGRVSKNRFVNLAASTYVEVIRGIPLLVQLFYIYFALGRFLSIEGMLAAIIAMSVCYGAYMGEIFRAGIESIDRGQKEAARSLGFNRAQTMRYVILPQAWRTILPPVGNEFIMLLKDSSLVSILAVSDLLRRGREFASESFYYFEAYTMVALIYLVITLLLSYGVSVMERRLNVHVRH